MDINIIVANNLKELRESRNLSLERTAKLTGVSKSMLGQIERREVTPTIAVLWKIANGLKVSFTSLTCENTHSASVVRDADVTHFVEDDGRFLNYPVFPFAEGRPFEIYRIIIKPGGTLKAEPHPVNSEEYITVFAGSVVIINGDDEYCLRSGDSIRFRADVAHSYSNKGDDDTELSMVIYYP